MKTIAQLQTSKDILSWSRRLFLKMSLPRLQDAPARRGSTQFSASRNPHRFERIGRALCCAALLSAAGVVAHPLTAAAFLGIGEGCDDRPGTPDLTEALAVSPTQITFRWRITARREGGRFFDFELWDDAGHQLGAWAGLDTYPQEQIPAGPAAKTYDYHDWVEWPFNNLTPGKRYCIRVMARTEGGKEGCTSEIWSGFSCATTPTPEIAASCQRYADTAYDQAKALQGMVQAGECRWEDGSGNIDPRWITETRRHFDWCTRVFPKDPGAVNRETSERNRILKTVCKPKPAEIVSKPAPAAPSSAPPPAPQCNVTVQISTDTCFNADSTPTEYGTAPTVVEGCGKDKDEAEKSARMHMAVKRCLQEDGAPPVPFCCTYKVNWTQPGCGCPTTTRAYSAGTCSGKLPSGTWPYCCPANTTFSNGVCKPIFTSPFASSINLPGHDYLNFASASASDCQSVCGYSASCKAWTYVFKTKWCWLKNEVPEPRLDKCCTSGIKGPAQKLLPHPKVQLPVLPGTHTGDGGGFIQMFPTCPAGKIYDKNAKACACPPGTSWDGKSCATPKPKPKGEGNGEGGTIGTMPQQAKPAPQQPQAKPKPPRVCPTNRPVGVYPNCCPKGFEYRSGRCQCPRGTDYIKGVCRVLAKPQPQAKPKAVPAPVCPADRPVGSYPNCCPKGTAYNNGSCRPVACPPGTSGVPPVCVPQKAKKEKPKQQQASCPPGYRKLRRPNKYGALCEPIEQAPPKCPADRPVGTPPHCCPQNTRFTEGFCYPLKCSPGWTGAPPHCQPPPAPKPAPKPAPTGPAPHATCPAGHLGTPPNCYCPNGYTGPHCENSPVR